VVALGFARAQRAQQLSVVASPIDKSIAPALGQSDVRSAIQGALQKPVAQRAHLCAIDVQALAVAYAFAFFSTAVREPDAHAVARACQRASVVQPVEFKANGQSHRTPFREPVEFKTHRAPFNDPASQRQPFGYGARPGFCEHCSSGGRQRRWFRRFTVGGHRSDAYVEPPAAIGIHGGRRDDAAAASQ